MTKILLVEDNEMNQDMLSRRLQRRGYELLFAMDGAKGVEIAQIELPDLILMDISLPIMDGWEATRRIKADPRTRSIPIIALTAHAMVGDRDKCVAAGCDDYDTKPVELSRLLEKMETLLANRQGIAAAVTTISQTPPPPAAVVTPTATTPARIVDPTSATILVIDDNEMNRDMLGRRLERSGYTMLLASGGKEGLDIIAKQPVDLVLLDIMMPDLSGIETLQIIRSQYSLAQLPVIMATAKDRSEDMMEAFEQGANDYVTKPIDLPVVLARIQSHLRTIQSARREQPPIAVSQEVTQPIFSPPPPVSAPSAPDNRLLLGRYQIVKQLSQDYFKHTYLAQDTQQPGQPTCLVQKLHIKSDRADLVATASHQLTKEIQAFRTITNPHIAKIFAACKQDEFFYLIQEQIESTSLADNLQAGRTLSLPDALTLIIQLLQILQTLHQQKLIHQHLQPVSFSYSDEHQLRLVDLGIGSRLAIILEPDQSNIANIYHPYPQHGHTLNIHSDIYAAAMITLQALTGTPPNQMPVDPIGGEIRWRHLRIVAESFAKILDKMISKNPDRCYHSIDSILTDMYQLPMVRTLLDRDSALLNLRDRVSIS
jgi:CheY-like chemotaxis protein